MKSKKKKLNTKVIVVVSLVFIIVVVTIFQSIIRNEEKLVINETDLYQYSGEIKIAYSGNVEIDKNNDITTINFDNKEESVILDSTPVYYAKESKVIFPKNMSIVFPREGKQFKVNYFSYITKNEYNEATLKDRTTEKMINNCFLYDGYDLYFLVGDYNVTLEGKEYKLSTFSYLRVDVLNGIIEIYDHANDTMTIVETDEEVILENEDIKANLSLDLIYYQGKSRLLIKKVDQLKNYS